MADDYNPYGILEVTAVHLTIPPPAGVSYSDYNVPVPVIRFEWKDEVEKWAVPDWEVVREMQAYFTGAVWEKDGWNNWKKWTDTKTGREMANLVTDAKSKLGYTLPVFYRIVRWNEVTERDSSERDAALERALDGTWRSPATGSRVFAGDDVFKAVLDPQMTYIYTW